MPGWRQVGKTTLALRLPPEREYISFNDLGLLRAAKDHPVAFIQDLSGPVKSDEIQRIPSLLPAIKLCLDEDRLKENIKRGEFS